MQRKSVYLFATSTREFIDEQQSFGIHCLSETLQVCLYNGYMYSYTDYKNNPKRFAFRILWKFLIVIIPPRDIFVLTMITIIFYLDLCSITGMYAWISHASVLFAFKPSTYQCNYITRVHTLGLLQRTTHTQTNFSEAKFSLFLTASFFTECHVF